MNQQKGSRFLLKKWAIPTLILMSLAISIFTFQRDTKNFVTYERTNARLGDSLLSYLHAKWISHRYGIPLLSKKFTYSSEFMLSNEPHRFSKINLSNFIEISIDQETILQPHSKGKPQIYVAKYFPECQWEAKSLQFQKSYFEVDWKDPDFRRIAQQMLTPTRCHPSVIPPKETVNIAIHFRDGGGFDSRDVRSQFPLKFPPLEFYVQGLLKMIPLFPDKNLYCYLFTDAINPSEIIEKIKTFVPSGTNLTLACRNENNAHNCNVVEDFLSFFEFDVLIYPQSSFSLVPSLIHDYAVLYTPVSCSANEGGYTIDQIKCEVNEPVYQSILSRASQRR